MKNQFKDVEKKKNNSNNYNQNKSYSQFSLKRMQIRRWFSLPSFNILDSQDESKRDYINLITSIKELPDVIDPSKFGEVKDGLAYVQMVLEGKEITEEFEKKLESRINKMVKIRQATLNDIQILVNLYNRAFMAANEPYAPMDEEKMAAIFHYRNTIILIGELYGKPVGFIIIDFEGKNKEKGIIAGLGILPEYQKKGIGTTLGVACWKYFKEQNVKELLCEVFIKNYASYKLISGIGFKPVKIKYYNYKDNDDE